MSKAVQHKKQNTKPAEQLESQQKKTVQAKSFTPPDSGINFTVQKKENKTGMPDNLKSGLESMSGLDLSDVKVHYNSSQPAQLNAHAFAQGNQIHVAPGQEKHLPHEGWHVVQQKQGRVKPTKQLKSSVAVNDDPALEKEADVMGAKAMQAKGKSGALKTAPKKKPSLQKKSIAVPAPGGIVQRVLDQDTAVAAINEATSITLLGGTTDKAYKVNSTNGEYPHLVIKTSGDLMPVHGAALAGALGMRAPETTTIDRAAVIARITALNPGALANLTKAHFIVMTFVQGKTLKHTTREDFNEGTFQEFGHMAAFDAMTGRTDLFENYEENVDDQENFNNVLIHQQHVVGIDISSDGAGLGDGFNSRKAMIDGILANPTTLSRFVERKVVGLLKDSSAPIARGEAQWGNQRLEGLINAFIVQRGMLALIARVGNSADAIAGPLERMPHTAVYNRIRAAVAYFTAHREQAVAGQHAVTEHIGELRAQQDRDDADRAEAQRLEAQAKREAAERKAQEEANKCCFITTACVNAKGLPDDCNELQVLRAFRDGYLASMKNGLTLISIYYEFSPLVVDAINRRPNASEIYGSLYKIISRCVGHINRNEEEEAYWIYLLMVLELHGKYTPTTVLPAIIDQLKVTQEFEQKRKGFKIKGF